MVKSMAKLLPSMPPVTLPFDLSNSVVLGGAVNRVPRGPKPVPFNCALTPRVWPSLRVMPKVAFVNEHRGGGANGAGGRACADGALTSKPSAPTATAATHSLDEMLTDECT